MKALALGALALLLVGCGSPTAPSTGAPTVVVKPGTPPTPTPTPSTPGAWSETFAGSLSSRWAVSNYTGINNTIFDPANVDLSQGALTLRMQQDRSVDGSQAVARGAEVYSVDKFSFGTYTWVLRASSTASSPGAAGSPGNGQTSGAFVWSPTTEIDFEQEGGTPTVMHCVMFKDGKNNGVMDAQMGDTVWANFHTYSFVWLPTSVTWFIDGQQVSQRTQDVPQDPASVIMNHWAIQHGVWGGSVQLGVPMFTHIRSFSFVPR